MRQAGFGRVLLGALVSLLTACGGASDPPSTPLAAAPPAQPAGSNVTLVCTPPVEGPDAPSPESLIGGTITGRIDPSFLLVVQGEQRLLFYGPDLPRTSRISGFVIAGNPGGWCDSSDRTTSNGIDHNLGTDTEARVYLYTPVKTNPPELAGSIRYSSSTYSLTGGSIPGSSYDGSAKPALADARGSWAMTELSGANSLVSIDEAGVITGSDRGCPFSGTVTVPSDESTNLLRVRLQVSLCSWQRLDQPYEGFVAVMPMTSGGARLLMWASANNGVDWDYVAAIGSRN
jgi:hypothetical protein